MNVKKLILLSCSVFLLSIFTGCGGSNESDSFANSPSSNNPPSGESIADLPVLGKAENWSLTRLDGSVLHSSELAGKVVVIDFWATWCPPCRAEIPGYVGMQQDLEQEGLVIVGVSLDEDGPEVVRKFAQRYGVNYEMVMGDERMVDTFGGVRVIPTTFLIDRDGQVRHRKEGMMERSEYEPLIRSLL